MDTYYIDTVEDVKKIAKMLDDINTPINKNNAALLHLCSIILVCIFLTYFCQYISHTFRIVACNY